jgi:hypothetical protein
MTILKERAVGSIRCGTNALGKGKGGGGVVLLLFTLDQPIKSNMQQPTGFCPD